MSQQVGANPGMPLIRPEQIQGLPHISEETKQQYRNGLANLWQKLEHSQAGSKEHTDALDKIRTASTKLMGMISGKAGNGMRPGSGGGQQRPGSQQMGGQQQQQQGNAPQLAAAQGQQGPQQQGQRPVGQQTQPPWTPKQQHELDSINIVQPGNVSGQQWENYRTQLQNGLRDAIMKRDFAFQRYNQLQLQIRSHQQSNKAVPEKAHAQLVEFRKLAEVATNNFRVFKARAAGADHNQAMAQVQAQAQQAQQQQQQQRANAQQGSAQQQQQSQQSDTKPANGPGRNSLSPPQYQNGFQQGQNQQGAPGQMTQQNMQQAPVAPQPQQSSPQSATQPQQGFQQNLAQQQPQHPNQQPRPAQINTQQIQPQHQQQQGTPASAMPPSATQQNPQRPQPLTHSAAMSQAAESYNRSQQQTQQQPQAAVQVPQAMPPFNANQGSGPPQSKDQASYPNLQTTTNSSTNPNSKFPIPRTLQLDPRNQAPVAGPPSRPSLAYSGMMSQPAMQRAPPYTLEGEGDRVLSKRKLDELVRQVTGAAPSSDNSESSSVLAPDVEESIMEVADNFVDEVITSACRLAKLRPNQTLDLRDVQMVLERNYGIRIPGYGLDETRTVRKFNPAPGWQNKMQAVQAGKVMGNRDS